MADSFKSELDWSPESWFSKRVAKPDGTKYTEDDVKSLNSHIPEYLDIEKNSKADGTWLKMPDGSTWQHDPRSWVMMQSKAYKQNYSPYPWWSGQARWKTNDKYGDKVTRFPYYNGTIWHSNREEYGDYFANIIDSRGLGDRVDYDPNDDNTYPEENVTGHTFLMAIPEKRNYRYLEQPKGTVNWKWMPYKLTNGTIEYDPNKYKDGCDKYNKTLTDDVVDWSKQLGDQGIFMYNVNDGPSQIGPRESDGWVPTENFPIDEFISHPGTSGAEKIIDGNNGDFNIYNSYKYAYNYTPDRENILKAFYGAKLNKKDWYAI